MTEDGQRLHADMIDLLCLRTIFMALITFTVLSVGSRDLVMSVSVHRVHVAVSTARFKSGGKSSHKTRETG